MADRSGKGTSDDLIPHNMPELGRTESCVSCVTAPDCLSGAMFGAVWAREIVCGECGVYRRVCLREKAASNLEL